MDSAELTWGLKWERNRKKNYYMECVLLISQKGSRVCLAVLFKVYVLNKRQDLKVVA